MVRISRNDAERGIIPPLGGVEVVKKDSLWKRLNTVVSDLLRSTKEEVESVTYRVPFERQPKKIETVDPKGSRVLPPVRIRKGIKDGKGS